MVMIDLNQSGLMDKKNLKILLENVKNGEINVEQAMDNLKSMPYDDLEFAKIDTHRALRRGFPEVIFCQGKTVEQIQLIVKKMMEYHELVLGMRADESVFEGLKKITANVAYNKYAKAVIIGDLPKPEYKGKIMVISAGTADMPVSEEAAITAEAMGNNVERLYDVGIAGIHRILNNRSKLLDASVLIVAAGMEGALPGDSRQYC